MLNPNLHTIPTVEGMKSGHGECHEASAEVGSFSNLWRLTVENIRQRAELVLHLTDQGPQPEKSIVENNQDRLWETYEVWYEQMSQEMQRLINDTFLLFGRFCRPGLGEMHTESIQEALIIPMVEGVQDAVEHGSHDPIQLHTYVTNMQLFLVIENQIEPSKVEPMKAWLEQLKSHAAFLGKLHRELDGSSDSKAEEKWKSLLQEADSRFRRPHPLVQNKKVNPSFSSNRGSLHRGNGMAQLAASRINEAWLSFDVKERKLSRMISIRNNRLMELVE